MLEKKQIILMVQELGERIGKADLGELFREDKRQDDRKIGHGQFRELASLCEAAECFDEIELLVKYNTAKQQSWAKKCSRCSGKKFGELIVDYMKNIRDTEQNACDVLTDLTYFFGYLYWQSRVWTMENPVRNNNNNNGRDFRNDQHRTNTQNYQRSYNGYNKPKP